MTGPHVQALIKLWHRQGFFSIESELQRAVDLDDAVPAESVAAELVEYVPPSDVLLAQGITRLQLLSFLRGDDSDVWNGADNQGGTRWVRYRAHQIDRVPTPDGNWVQMPYTDHDGSTHAAQWTIGGSDYDAYAVVRMVDFIIDAVIAEYGSEEILDGAA